MDIKDKIVNALCASLHAEDADVRLEIDDGISGFVVSRDFEGMSMLDRQTQIDKALNSAPLTPKNEARFS